MKIFNKLSLKAKLFIFNSILVFFLVLVSVVAQFGIHSSNVTIKELSSNESSHWLYQSLITKSDIQALLRLAFEPYAPTKWVTGNTIKDVTDTLNTFNQNLDKFAAESKFTPEEQAKFTKLQTAWKETRKKSDQTLENIRQGKLNREVINKQIIQIEDSFLNINDILSDILGDLRKKSLSIYTTAQFKEKIYFIGLLLLLFLTMVISLFSFIFSNKLNKNFKNISKELFFRSNEVSDVVGSLKKSSDSLNSAISEQSNSIHNTTAAINQMTSTVNNTTSNTKDLYEVSKSSSEKADNGKSIINNLVSSMETIQKSNEQLQDISEIIGQINTKTAVINNIVSKTELLSLNASIESARAGEQGKGFAVVAEEVGNLAKISGKSAKEIQDLITKSEDQVDKILEVTKNRVNDVKEVTNEAQKSFAEISENVNSLTLFIEKITLATQEQEIGIKQISSAMEQIEKSTQSIQASINVTSECTESLIQQDIKLDHSSKEIELLINGK